MRRLVREGAQDPHVKARAREVAAASPDLHPADAVFRFVQALPYRRDESLAEAAGLSDTSEILQGAPHQLALERAGLPVEGDCDCRCVLAQSMLEALGYRTAFVLVRGRGRDDYSHVYSEVTLEDGRSLPLDTIMDGNEGRPRFAAGDEIGPPDARGRKVIPVQTSPVKLLALAALAALAWRTAR
jgi:hypothetical protein